MAPRIHLVKDFSTSWEGEAPAEPQAFIGTSQTIRFGRSLTSHRLGLESMKNCHSSQQFFHDMRPSQIEIGQTLCSAIVIEGQSLVIQTEGT